MQGRVGWRWVEPVQAVPSNKKLGPNHQRACPACGTHSLGERGVAQPRRPPWGWPRVWLQPSR